MSSWSVPFIQLSNFIFISIILSVTETFSFVVVLFVFELLLECKSVRVAKSVSYYIIREESKFIQLIQIFLNEYMMCVFSL